MRGTVRSPARRELDRCRWWLIDGVLVPCTAIADRMLREAGHGNLADELAGNWVGRNVIPGMWTFELIEAFERTYYEVAVASELQVRETVMDGRQHIQEAERKVRRRQDGPRDDEG